MRVPGFAWSLALLLPIAFAGSALAQPKRGLARLEGSWVSASTSPNVDDWVWTFQPRGRFTEHTPGGGDVGGTYALVGAHGDRVDIRATLRIGRMRLRTLFHVDIAPDGSSITMTSENTPNEPRVFRRVPSAETAP